MSTLNLEPILLIFVSIFIHLNLIYFLNSFSTAIKMENFQSNALIFSSISNSTTKASRTQLGYWTCYFLNIPDNLRHHEFTSSIENKTLYSCSIKTRFLFGENAGPTFCLVLCILIAILGVLGVGANVVNILVLRHSMKASSLQKLLIILAGFDFVACLFGLLTSIILQIILDNVNRSKETLIIFKIVVLLYALGRTGSVFITILITIERYFVVAYHYKAKAWLNSRRPLYVAVVWLLIILLINLPWWLNSAVASHDNKRFWKGPLSKYPAIFVATRFGTQLYFSTWLRPVHVFIDFVLPFPILLLFNGLLYRFIYNWNKKRENLTGSRAREVNAAKMFSIVVLSLFSCHTFAVIQYFVNKVTGKVYKEVVLLIMLAVILNAAINFFVYYASGRDFRKHFWLIFDLKGEKNITSCERDTSTTEHADQKRCKSRQIPIADGGGEGDVILHSSSTASYTSQKTKIKL